MIMKTVHRGQHFFQITIILINVFRGTTSLLHLFFFEICKTFFDFHRIQKLADLLKKQQLPNKS